MFCFSVFRPTSCLLCAFEQYLFVRFHNLDSLYRSANVCIVKECIINKTIYHPLSVFSFSSPKGAPKINMFGETFSKKTVNINGSFFPERTQAEINIQDKSEAHWFMIAYTLLRLQLLKTWIGKQDRSLFHGLGLDFTHLRMFTYICWFEL